MMTNCKDCKHFAPNGESTAKVRVFSGGKEWTFALNCAEPDQSGEANDYIQPKG